MKSKNQHKWLSMIKTPRCQHHKWLPVIKVDENLMPKYGSLGSQIGYKCEQCGKEKVLWPSGHINYGTEKDIITLNKRAQNKKDPFPEN